MYVKKREKKPNKLIKTICEFGQCTSFHGVKYIVAKDNTIFEKLLWVIVVLMGICGSVYMTMIFWDRFSSNPIRITIQSLHKQTSIIPFPGVTVCTAIRQVPDKVERFLNKLVLPSNLTVEDVRDAIPLLMGYMQSIKVDMASINMLDFVFRQNGFTSAKDIFAEIEPSCSEMMLKCKLEQVIYPCEKLFKTSFTKDGRCCSFNTKGNEKDFKKYRTLYYGVQMGLSLMIDPLTTNVSRAVSTLSSTGIKVLIHNTEDYPGISSTEKILGNGTETFIRILGTKLISSSDVKSLTVEQRNCLFENDKTLKYFKKYRDTNCGTECKMHKMFHYCKCIPFTFPKSEKPVCNITSIGCLTKNYNPIFRSSAKLTLINNSNKINSTFCECPPQCNDVLYTVQASSIPLSPVTYTTSAFYKTELGQDFLDKMVVHLYFGSHYQTVMLRDTITSTYYLLSSFGGVFSLFLGCSFLSILEIIYFFCFRLFAKENI